MLSNFIEFEVALRIFTKLSRILNLAFFIDEKRVSGEVDFLCLSQMSLVPKILKFKFKRNVLSNFEVRCGFHKLSIIG